MTKYEWLLFPHVTGAFLFLGAAVVALVLNFAALRRDRPSEIAVLLRLTSLTNVGFAVGLLLLLVFGLWLVHDAGYGYGDGWIVAALVLFVLSNVFGAVGGERAKPAGELAERLAAQGDRAERRAQGSAARSDRALPRLRRGSARLRRPRADDLETGSRRVIALIRPVPWDFPLFVHVFGAVALFGGVGTLVLLSFAAHGMPAQTVFARRIAFATLITVVWPAYVVLGWLALRRRPNVTPYFAGLASVYLVALGVAWWAMTTKPGA